jgi:hypothetical protein
MVIDLEMLLGIVTRLGLNKPVVESIPGPDQVPPAGLPEKTTGVSLEQ